MFHIPTFILALLLLCLLAISVVGMATRQLHFDVQPSPLLPTFQCEIILFFYNRRTICPGRPTENYRTPRDEGFFECVPAWDKYIAAFALVVISCAVTLVALLIALFSIFHRRRDPVQHDTSYLHHSKRLITIAVLSTLSFMLLTASWPMVRSLVTLENCDRKIKGAVLSTGTTVLDYHVDYGHIILIVAWGLSFFVMLWSIINAACFALPSRAKKQVVVVDNGAPVRPSGNYADVNNASDFNNNGRTFVTNTVVRNEPVAV